MTLAACLLCVAFVSPSALAQTRTAGAEQEVTAADEALTKAIGDADGETYGRLAAEEFVYVINGTVIPKAERLERLKRAGKRAAAVVERSIHVYGDAAVVQGLAKYGDDRPPQRYTRVWVKQNGVWRTVANHGSTVTPAQ